MISRFTRLSNKKFRNRNNIIAAHFDFIVYHFLLFGSISFCLGLLLSNLSFVVSWHCGIWFTFFSVLFLVWAYPNNNTKFQRSHNILISIYWIPVGNFTPFHRITSLFIGIVTFSVLQSRVFSVYCYRIVNISISIRWARIHMHKVNALKKRWKHFSHIWDGVKASVKRRIYWKFLKIPIVMVRLFGRWFLIFNWITRAQNSIH